MLCASLNVWRQSCLVVVLIRAGQAAPPGPDWRGRWVLRGLPLKPDLAAGHLGLDFHTMESVVDRLGFGLRP